jgi:MFS transporter, PAT family, beta-lactamase induction signal transducer AmpG
VDRIDVLRRRTSILDLSVIGMTSLYGAAWNLKFLWSPAIDRYGSFRKLVIALELLLGIAIFACAFFTNVNLVVIGVCLAIVSLLSATHDIAVDGFYLAALDTRTQLAASGFRVAAYRLALAFGNGVLVVAAGRFGFSFAFALAGAVMIAQALLHARVLPRPRVEPKDDASSVFREAFASLIAKDKALIAILFLITYRAGDALMFAMNAPFLKDAGLDTTARGFYSGVLGTAVSIAGSIFGGIYIARRSLDKTLKPFALIQSTAILIYVALAFLKPPFPILVAGILAEQFFAGLGTAALSAFALRFARGSFKATHFAVATALAGLSMTVVGVASGFIATRFGFGMSFFIAFLVSIPGVVLTWFVPKDDHAVPTASR